MMVHWVIAAGYSWGAWTDLFQDILLYHTADKQHVAL
jgi:hypothetical protein